MITLITGDNSFEVKRAVDEIAKGFEGEAERFDGGDLELSQLPDLLMGGTLFATNRLIIIRDISDNKKLWEVLPDWIGRVSDEVHLVLVEPSPDKRTKTYKDLHKNSDVKSYAKWGDRDTIIAEKWLANEAALMGVRLDKTSVNKLVARVGMDQWQLFHALEKLSVMGEITPEIIEQNIEANPRENVFDLLNAALNGNASRVQEMIRNLQRAQDPYMTFGLLSGQIYQLATLAASGKSSAEVAADIGAHPFALSKLAAHARKLGINDTKRLTKIFADTDMAMKSTTADPWLLVEGALIKTASG